MIVFFEMTFFYSYYGRTNQCIDSCVSGNCINGNVYRRSLADNGSRHVCILILFILYKKFTLNSVIHRVLFRISPLYYRRFTRTDYTSVYVVLTIQVSIIM